MTPIRAIFLSLLSCSSTIGATRGAVYVHEIIVDDNEATHAKGPCSVQ